MISLNLVEKLRKFLIFPNSLITTPGFNRLLLLLVSKDYQPGCNYLFTTISFRAFRDAETKNLYKYDLLCGLSSLPKVVVFYTSKNHYTTTEIQSHDKSHHVEQMSIVLRLASATVTWENDSGSKKVVYSS